jgi:carboxyl-terminal processing protease
MSRATRSRQLRWLLIGAAALLGASIPARAAGPPPGKGPPPAAAPALTPEQRRRNLESFDCIWTTIRDTHWDPRLGGLDWKGLRAELRPQVEQARDMSRARAVMTDLMARLKQSHFALIPREAYEELAKGPSGGPGGVGLVVRVVGGQALVVRVREGMPAAKRGVRPGWRIVKVNGQDLAPVLARVGAAFKGSPDLEWAQVLAVMSRLSGKVGGRVRAVFLDGADKEVALSLDLAAPEGTPVRYGHLPLRHVRFESRRLGGTIGYFALNAFFDPDRVMKAFAEAVRANRRADGLILDLRGNPGGLGEMAVGMANRLVNKPGLKLGTSTYRGAVLHDTLNPQAETYDGPLAVLVDG